MDPRVPEQADEYTTTTSVWDDEALAPDPVHPVGAEDWILVCTVSCTVWARRGRTWRRVAKGGEECDD